MVIDLLPADRVVEVLPMSATHHATLSEAVEAFLLFRRNRQTPEATMRTQGYLLHRMVRDVGDLQMRNLRPSHLTKWFYDTGGLMGGKAPIESSTHNTYRAGLKAFFEWANKRGMTKHDMLEDVVPLPERKKKRLQPTPDILLGFLDSARNPRDRAYLAVAMNTALRTSEITRIKVGDVDLARGILRVTRSKGGEEDDLPITGDLDPELRQWLTAYAESIDVALSPEHWLFPVLSVPSVSHWDTAEDGTRFMVRHPRTPQPTRQWTCHTQKVIHEGLRAVGLPTKQEGTHTIRRAVARAYFDSMSSEVGYDASLRTVAALLGHKRTSTTEIYLGLSSERERRDKMLRGKPFLTAMVSTENVVPLRVVD